MGIMNLFSEHYGELCCNDTMCSGPSAKRAHVENERVKTKIFMALKIRLVLRCSVNRKTFHILGSVPWAIGVP